MLKITNVTCESQVHPLDIDTAQPRFGWQILSDKRNVIQSAYQVQVSLSPAFESILWDSLRVNSDQSLFVVYDGPPLASRTRYYFRVCLWDEQSEASGWSETSWFEMGILTAGEWKANWITHPFKEKRKVYKPAYYFRKVFHVARPLQRVRVYASALGLYEVHLNGKRLGDELFTPGLTEYRHHIQYQVYEANLLDGTNVVGMVLGEGWYRGRFEIKGRNTWGKTGAGFLQMHLEYQDGSQEIICTDPTWMVSTGPILRSDIYDGEDYDARLETNWLEPNFEGTGWSSARIYANYPVSRLVAPLGEKVHRMETVAAKRIFQTPAGETVVDFGQNMVGWIKLDVKGETGRHISIDFAEILDKNGNFYRDNYRTARSQIIYTCKGTGDEVYEPHFTFFGFRYARINNYPQPDLSTLTGIVIHSNIQPKGKFACSNPLINRLQENIRWGQKGNFLDIPSDCPQRDERLGWTGDAQVFFRTAAFNMDVERFFRKWLKDLAVSHSFTGAVPFWIPAAFRMPFASSGWGDAAIIVPWEHYLVYGDKEILADQYASMKKWFGYEKRGAARLKLKDIFHLRRYRRINRYIWDSGFHLGDWLAPNEGQKEWKAKAPWVATAYFAHSADILEHVAALLGNEKEALQFKRIYDSIKSAFCQNFLGPDGTIRNGFQTAYVLALEFGLLPDDIKAVSARHLAEDIHRHGDHLTTGFLGTPPLNFALSRNGQVETAYRLLLQESCPSWLYPVKLDATTIWERWDAIQPDGSTNESSVGGGNMVSFNHYAYGAVGDWLYRVVAGLDIDPQQPAYKHILIQPQPGGGLEFAEACFESGFGPVRSYWKISGNKMHLSVLIPPNASARVVLPRASREQVCTGDGKLAGSIEYRDITERSGTVSFEVGSGDYAFDWMME